MLKIQCSYCRKILRLKSKITSDRQCDAMILGWSSFTIEHNWAIDYPRVSLTLCPKCAEKATLFARLIKK